MTKIIEVRELSKFYGSHQAVKDISFDVTEGSFFSFLGTNGAGKSTVINMLTTLIQKDAGEIKVGGYVMGQEDEKIREIIGCVFQEGLLDRKLTVAENLKIRGSFYQLSKAELAQKIKDLSQLIQIADFLHQPYGKLSGGQKRRADIVRALLNEPKILFLDEPTAGLDPLSRKILWETIQDLQTNLGMTVFLTTHYMEEADQSDKIVVIDRGQVLAEGTPIQLKEQYSRTIIKLYQVAPRVVADLITQGFQIERDENDLTVYCPQGYDSYLLLEKYRGQFASFEVKKGNMDDVFLSLTTQEVQDQ